MANEAAETALAANGDVAKEEPGPFQDCRDVAHVTLFFDGTGNNWAADKDTRSWSNVGRIYDAAVKSPDKAI